MTSLRWLLAQRSKAIEDATEAASRGDLDVAGSVMDFAIRLGEVIAEREAAVLAELEADWGRP